MKKFYAFLKKDSLFILAFMLYLNAASILFFRFYMVVALIDMILATTLMIPLSCEVVSEIKKEDEEHEKSSEKQTEDSNLNA